jgi:hypothetical protein
MLGRSLHREETSAALALALSGTIVVLMANGPGSVLLKRIVSGGAVEPCSRVKPAGAHDTRVYFWTNRLRTAA